MSHWIDRLVSLDAGKDAVAWAHRQPSLAVAWRKCRRGDWMLRLLGRSSGALGSDAHRRLVSCACDCAELSAHLATPDGQMAIALCLTIARDWASGGESDMEDVRAASVAATADYAGHAAVAATADDAAYAAIYAAAAAADYATDYAAADAARSRVLAECADIVRSHYPKAPRLEATC